MIQKLKNKLRSLLSFHLLRYISSGFFKKNRSKKNFFYKRQKINRIALINKAITQMSGRQPIDYLEIGCDLDSTFKSISLPLENKIGVDPARGGTLRMTSDEFFENNNKKFDIIFIDGLHEYKQCKKDLLNSLKVIKKGGYIFLDDMLPQTWAMAQKHRIVNKWMGDVWKVGVEISKIKEFKYFIAMSNYGIGFIKIGDNDINFKDLTSLDFEKLHFDDFAEYAKNANNILSGDEALKKIGEL